MIVLDTNVLSELMRQVPEPSVFAWVADQDPDELYTTAINRAEILYGLALLPDGRRRDRLADAAAAMCREEFAGRVLPFSDDSAVHYARLRHTRRDAGAPIESLDALIAAAALSAGAAVATRDVSGFAGCGLVVINPWEPS